MKLDHEKVRWHRDRLGLTLDTLGEKAEVAKGTVLRAEHGEDVRPSSGRRIARALGVEISDLIPEKPGSVGELVGAGKDEVSETRPTADPHRWAQAHSARLHGMSNEEWDTHIRELESTDEIEQEFHTLLDEAKDLHAAYGGDRWFNPENKENRVSRARRLREIRTDRLADLASAAAKTRDETLLKHVTDALFEEAHS
jgi:transcriptional regulator with XRE-family HTH domain